MIATSFSPTPAFCMPMAFPMLAPHAAAGIDGIQRRQCPQSITADIAGNYQFRLAVFAGDSTALPDIAKRIKDRYEGSRGIICEPAGSLGI